MKPKKKISMYKKGGKNDPPKGGFNPQPDTSYQSPASKAARKKVAKKQKEQDMADIEFIRSLLRRSRHMTLDGSKGEKFDVPESSKEMQDALKKRMESGEYKLPSALKPPKSFKGGGQTDPPKKKKAPALSPTGRLLDSPFPEEKEFDPYNDTPYFLRKDYVEGKSAVAAGQPSAYEKARNRRSNNYDRLAEAATININEALYEGEMSKEEHAKAKKAIQKFKENKDKHMREAGFGMTPEFKRAQDRAIRRWQREKMKNKKAKGGKMPEYNKGGSLPTPPMKAPKQRVKAKKRLGM